MRRSVSLGWISLGALLVTGGTNLWLRGITWSAITSSGFWSAGFGRVLAWKLALVASVLGATLAHELTADRRAIGVLEREPTSEHAERIRRTASMLGRLVMVLSLIILFLAVALVRGSLG